MNSSSEQSFEEAGSPFSDASDSPASSEGPSKTKRVKRSVMHDHFVLIADGKWKCKHCKTTLSVKASSTSSCMRHLTVQHPSLVPPATARVPSTPFSKEVFEEKLVTTVVMECLPFSIVESKSLEELFKYCNPNVVLPSRFKLKTDILARFDTEKAALMKTLQNTPGKISCITDNWTSSNMHPYQGVIVQYIDSNWDLCSVVLDLTILEGPHTGTNMASALIEVLTDFKISDKLLAITTDNASNNNTMINAIANHMNEKGLPFDSQNNHIRCFAHIVNLACNAAFDKIKNAAPHVYNQDSDSDDIEGGDISLITKLRAGIKAIRKSTVKREVFRRHCVSENMKHNELLLDVKTRWNSTYYMIKRCLKLRVPYGYTLQADTQCSKYILTNDEINALEKIVELLKPFKTATKDISNEKFPSISLCALLYVELFNHLENFFPSDSNKKKPIDKGTNQPYPEWLQTAAKSAWDKLSNYYPTSDGLAYVIGSVMDPVCKLQFFTKQFKPDVVRSYRRALTNYWGKYYKPSPEEAVAVSGSPGKCKNAWLRHLQGSTQSTAKDELEMYLAEKISINTDKSALEWWKLHEDQYPNVAKMARDFLAISGSGVPVERLFSNGPDLLRNRRQSLADETIRKCLCLKLWLSKNQECNFGKAASEKMGGD